ncbi:MAG: calcium/sodium antiporter [Planctomycetaceae bacterium]
MIIALMLLGGLVVLTVGAELLVRGASKLAALARVSPLVIGLTVVAYGTSMPEMTVSSFSAFRGEADIALGNVVGSNIFNVLFILGCSALIIPLRVNLQLLRFDVPLMIGASILTWCVAFDGNIGLIDGLLFLAGIFAYTGWSIHASRRESTANQAEFDTEYGTANVANHKGRQATINAALVVVGLVFLVLGSKWFVDGAIAVARMLEVDERIIGLTLVAAGTSLPELATSVVAAIKGERDIAVGNIIGSNIFNILAVLGAAGVLGTIAGDDGITVRESYLRFDIPVMIAIAIACLPIFFAGHTISRWNGALFLFYYVVYTAWLIMAERGNPNLPTFTYAVLVFLLPLTVVVLAIDVWRHLKQRRSPA